jgi:hypothetical protein
LADPTAVISLSVTTTTALLIAAAPVPSIKRAAFNTTIPFPMGGSGVIRGAEVCAAAGTHKENRRTVVSEIRFKFITNQFLGFGVWPKTVAF